jgi:hypothetical protein
VLKVEGVFQSQFRMIVVREVWRADSNDDSKLLSGAAVGND